jgi:histidinol-phosphate aminotransferase
MKTLNLEKFARPNILAMKAYSSARDEYTGNEGVFLDANENPFPSAVNRYPDPYQRELKTELARIKKVREEQIIVGNGSDEVLDLIYRAFCTPGKDKVVTIKPSYGMYGVLAETNDVALVEVPLDADFNLDATAVLEAAKDAKIIVLCSPNNPSGNLLNRNEVLRIVQEFPGLVVVDEAYIDFSNGKSLLAELDAYENLFVSQTLSKAYGLAGIRVGLGFGSPKVIALLNKVKPPYNVNGLSQRFALARLLDIDAVAKEVLDILLERSRLLLEMKDHALIREIYRTDSNFILFKVDDANAMYDYFAENGVVVRNRSSQYNCENCLRVSVGTKEENDKFLQLLSMFSTPPLKSKNND